MNEDTGDSIVQPGSDLPFELPKRLDGELVELRKGLCHGAYSEIYIGEWKKDQVSMKVCLKSLRQLRIDTASDPEGARKHFRRRVLRETWIWKKADHENIYPFIGWREVGDKTYLVSPWAEKGSLDAYLTLNPDLLAAERIRLVLEASRGLAYLHDLNPQIVHGDLKPENILIKNDSKAALCDFGVSRVIIALQPKTGLTTGTAGTYVYQAPEILLYDGRPTPKSDVYAMAGVILWTMSGKAPFWQKPTQGALAVALDRKEKCQRSDHPAFLEADPLWSFLEKCWNSEASERPSAQQVIQELEQSTNYYKSPAPPYDTVKASFDAKST